MFFNTKPKSEEKIKFAQEELNNRPRKVLDWETSKNALKKLVGAIEN